MIPPPREKDTSIPKLLEQIVLKAMQVEPGDRYASARELAEDIKRYVSDEPVNAYQESGLEKSRRWIRKNRSLVGAAIVMLLLVTVGAIGFGFVKLEHSQELAKRNQELEVSKKEVEGKNQELENSKNEIEGKNQELRASNKDALDAKIKAEKERDRANKSEKRAKDNEELAQQKLADIKKSQEEFEAYKLKINKIANSLDLVLIPAGTFMMGSPETEKTRNNDETQHEVTITKPYYMGKNEVTQELWVSIMGKNPSELKGNNLPVTDVSWEDCQNFIRKLNENTKGGYRLPTEAEWEFACRAGTTTAYSVGNIITTKDANYWTLNYSEPVAVGRYKPNAFGLYDMHGNVFEWCEDWYENYREESETDPKGPRIGTARVVRGVPNISGATIRSSSRNIRFPPNYHGSVGGFRLAKTIDSEDQLKPNVKEFLLKAKKEEEAKVKKEAEEAKAKEAQKEAGKSLQKKVKEKEYLGQRIMLDLILIPAGKFKMGDPRFDRLQVTLTKPFYMGKYEITQEQWEAVMGKNPSSRTIGAKLPVTDVSWNDCQEFIKKLNAKTNGGYRLPTEAEWEYACRAGTTTKYSFGDEIRPRDANYRDSNIGGPIEVGSYQPNAFGLYDMHGNVEEWCEDWYEDIYRGAVTDPKGPVKGEKRVLRGGSFNSNGSFARSSDRSDNSPNTRVRYYGFRLVKTP